MGIDDDFLGWIIIQSQNDDNNDEDEDEDRD